MTWNAVVARRLDRHGLAAPRDWTPADAVSAMCGAHAQVLSAAELSVGLRVPGATRTTVREALWEERSLVKTYGPRGTVHLFAARDLPMWTGALDSIPPVANHFTPDVRMSPEQVDQVVAAIAEILKETEMTPDELTGEIVDRVGSWAGDLVMPAFQGFWPRWRQAISTAANRGALCFGPNRGRKVTYTSPQRWLPGFEPMADGMSELLRRYLHAYGPVTPQQFAQWLNAPRGWATGLFESLVDELEPVEVNGAKAWQLAGDTQEDATPGGVRLLPYFDAYTVGCHPRELVFPGKAFDRALAAGQAGNFPVLLVDGAVSGVWHQKRSGRKLAITVEPIGKVARKALEEQVERVAAILEGTPTLTIGTVTVGAHA
ncbi:winged helix DNA-binding domain-containing protein [Lentzea nigeriaca]|uniref:winged helix DNA-binding domain-containing protein n=1 Tax=Lentzea nigeriaca TaxID=1128665 RepID=UPI0019585DCC|nr:winged helix DNA-binding domain-containing protein [Lentzea nigeriaca]MBM7862191.1 uncharacterized protein YukE [Lentzea nigeriaca]